MSSWNKGKKFPHSKEWEERRLKSVREASKKRTYKGGYKRPKSHIEPMRKGLMEWRENNPEKSKELSIKNLPKDVSLEKNGNWKGGKTKESRDFRTQNSGKLKKWRNHVLTRDGHRCVLCGSEGDFDSKGFLDVHHIIPISETRLTAFLPMNGITLCKECHKKTDSYGGKARHILMESGIGRTKVLIRTIPHKFQAYETVGNYQWTDEGILVIFISELGNSDWEFLVAMHEKIEAFLVRNKGISVLAIDAFDMIYEKCRNEGRSAPCGCPITLTSEPGEDPHAPYYSEHQFASGIERTLASILRVNWSEYDEYCASLSKQTMIQ